MKLERMVWMFVVCSILGMVWMFGFRYWFGCLFDIAFDVSFGCNAYSYPFDMDVVLGVMVIRTPKTWMLFWV